MSKHPDGIRGEVKEKGGNITWAGKNLQQKVKEMGLKYSDVIVTTLVVITWPHRCYFDQVAYEYIVHEDRSA